jgi:endo-beta-N-acetylglucosaminidase D
MKKTKSIAVVSMACLLGIGSPAALRADELSPTATDAIFDFSNVSDVTLLNLFYNALQQGRRYPTEEEFRAQGILPSDIAFIRSHVRKRAILDRSADRLLSDTYEKRDLWMNIPMGDGKGTEIGMPTGYFASDVYSMWNYTNLFGSWNHSIFTAPSVWVDAAHKNGTTMMSGIKFFESWTSGSGDGTWSSLISAKNSDGTFKYAEPLINVLMFFGSDGINYNWEDSSYSNTDVVAFHKQLYKIAEQYGFNEFKIGIYTSNSGLTTYNVNALFGNSEGRTAATMLNYSSSDFSYSMATSVTAAETAMGTSEDLYAGVWIVSMNRGWTRLNTGNAKRCGLCLWGEHASSRFWSYNSGADAYEAQSNYQALLERGFSGGNRNPLSRPAISNTGNNWEWDGTTPPLSTFAGLATWIPERSAIQGNLPFGTNFNIGNGDRYNYKGKKTAGSWYNMGNQDIVPTYRWLVVNGGTSTASTAIQPEFSHDDAYTGGSCLKLTGKSSATSTDIVLFKTQLTSSSTSPYAKIAVKSGVAGDKATNLYVILRKSNGTWLEFPVGNTSGAAWEEKKIDLTSLSQTDVIDRIGLRVKNSDASYKLYVGKLEINDNVKTTPAAVKDMLVEVKEETKTSMSAKISWKVDKAAVDRSAWDLLFNDEANIDHFEILYKNGEEGRISEIGRTTSWSTFISDILFEGTDDKPYIGVRAASTDLKTYSDVEWVAVSRAAQDALPVREVNTYGISQMDPNCDGADIARQQRFVEKFTTTGAEQNIEYSASSAPADGTQYVNALDHVMRVRQGQQVTLYIKCYDTTDAYYNGTKKTDGLRYCFAGGWIDLDGSGTFNPDDIETNPSSGERVFFLGSIRAATPSFETAGITKTFTIPADARPGQSRLRIVFSDAWFAGSFLPTGLHSKGFSMDFSVEIVGDNEPRPLPADNHDQGVADEPEELGAASNINTVDAAVASFRVAGDMIHFSNVDDAWIYNVNGTLVKALHSPSAVSIADYNKGVYIVRMQQGKVIRSGKFVK